MRKLKWNHETASSWTLCMDEPDVFIRVSLDPLVGHFPGNANISMEIVMRGPITEAAAKAAAERALRGSMGAR